jgi:tripartite-type tricarboxylate transporter receptor subunit TctC
MKKLLIIMLLLSSTLSAQTIKLVVPFAPSGSGPDGVARVLQELLLDELGKASAIEYRPGAGGMVGISSVARDTSNSTVLLVTSSAIAIHQVTQPNLSKDLIPIAYIGYYPIVLVANNRFAFTKLANWNTIPSDYLITAAVGGVGSSAHLNTIYLKNITNKNILSVQYKGAGPALIDLLGGRTDIGMQFLPNVSQYIDSKQLIAIGIINNKRLPQYPEIPTFDELGYKNFGFKTWIAVLANPNACRSELKKIEKMLVAVLSDKEKSKRFERIGLVIEPSQISNTRSIINRDSAKIQQYFDKYGTFEQQ